MSEIVNLRQARKRVQRMTKEAEAAANRARFGQSKADRKLAEAEKDKQRKILDAARRDDLVK
jgi:hypothetical protein